MVMDRDWNAAVNILKLALSTVGHTGIWVLDPNALGDSTSTLALSNPASASWIYEMNKESYALRPGSVKNWLFEASEFKVYPTGGCGVITTELQSSN